MLADALKALLSLLGLVSWVTRLEDAREQRAIGGANQKFADMEALQKQEDIAHANEDKNAALSSDDVMRKLRAEYGRK